MIPLIDPAATRSDTIKQNTFRACSPIHLKLNFWIFKRDICISTGKYTLNGQSETPIRPRILLKNGNNIATRVTTITYTDLHTNLNVLNLYTPSKGILMGILSLSKLLSGHLLLHQSSTSLNIGWLITCTKQNRNSLVIN